MKERKNAFLWNTVQCNNAANISQSHLRHQYDVIHCWDVFVEEDRDDFEWRPDMSEWWNLQRKFDRAEESRLRVEQCELCYHSSRLSVNPAISL